MFAKLFSTTLKTQVQSVVATRGVHNKKLTIILTKDVPKVGLKGGPKVYVNLKRGAEASCSWICSKLSATQKVCSLRY